MFVKGKSGNPCGRPKEAMVFTKKAQKFGQKALNVLVKALKSDNEKYRIMAAAIILDRAYGKAPQEVTNPDGSLTPKVDVSVTNVYNSASSKKDISDQKGRKDLQGNLIKREAISLLREQA